MTTTTNPCEAQPNDNNCQTKSPCLKTSSSSTPNYGYGCGSRCGCGSGCALPASLHHQHCCRCRYLTPIRCRRTRRTTTARGGGYESDCGSGNDSWNGPWNGSGTDCGICFWGGLGGGGCEENEKKKKGGHIRGKPDEKKGNVDTHTHAHVFRPRRTTARACDAISATD